jgi:hypothetical protein
MAPKCRAKHKEKVANAPASLYERFMDDASEEMVKPKMGERTPLISPPLLSSPLLSPPLLLPPLTPPRSMVKGRTRLNKAINL